MSFKVEVVVNNEKITICFRGRNIAEFGIDPQSGKILRKLNDTDVSENVNHVLFNLSPVSVDVITFEDPKDSFMALPKAHRRAAANETIAARKSDKRHNYERDFDSVSDSEAKSILHEIIGSLRNNPHQTKAERSKETHRIATKLGVKPMSVAGVRANMTRGVYGNIDI